MNQSAPRLFLNPQLKFFLRRFALARRLFLPRLVRDHYFATFGRPLNTRNPRTFAEKITCAKLHSYFEQLAPFVDKYSVRRYVASVAGESILAPLLAIVDRASDLDWHALPEAFVLKATHGSGWNVIVRDKASADPLAIGTILDGWLGKSYFLTGLEPQYANVPPRILAEGFLGPPSKDPVDYKFHCFGSEPRYIQVDCNRSSTHTRMLYDTDWNALKVASDKPAHPQPIPPPPRLAEMLSIARRLAAPFPYVRVDLYAVEDRIFFGELTFTPQNGAMFFDPPEFGLTMGDGIDVSAYRRPPPTSAFR